ncbi:nucleotide exchange factor GrpE [Stagnimonas aquatica]|uniref:Protein GrpE n=1 Tax=Stagnimonas aquatica TaxID=2689987 RepID=A0A3N0VE27_9GAMM|nr:nucleotide exchange factor GrpE [Stagnimonas aquatica]ROH90970.1 nucleotide exchange factor GrpE [Stagnimonas aquatica]
MTDAHHPTPDAAAAPEPGLSPEAELARLRDQLAEAQLALTAARDAQLRAAAEAENRIRRAENEAAKARKFASEEVLKDFLHITDSLELGLKAAGTVPDGVAKALVDGVQMTLKQLLSALEKHGVRQIDPHGQPFNAEHHQAMSMAPGGELPANHVLSVMQKGYSLHDRLLRPALVVVSQGGG